MILQVTESDLERAEERGEMGETKIMELEEELKVIVMMMMKMIMLMLILMVMMMMILMLVLISMLMFEFKVVATNLKSLEVAEEKANQREVRRQSFNKTASSNGILPNNVSKDCFFHSHLGQM